MMPLPPLNGGPPPPPNPAFVHGPTELCQHPFVWETRRPAPSPDWIEEEKFDGIRLLWIGGELVTREGEPFQAASHLASRFQRLEQRAGTAMFFDAEYVSAGGFLGALSEFKAKEGTGIAMVFDGFPLDEWRSGKSKLCLEDRRRVLDAIFGHWNDNAVRLVTQRQAPWAPGLVLKDAEFIWANGGEGLVLKHRRSIYERCRSPLWLKLKRSLRLKGLVHAIHHEGAAITFDYHGKHVRVAVPPHLRKTATPLSVGMTVIVEAMEWTEKGSLRQGRVDWFGNEEKGQADA